MCIRDRYETVPTLTFSGGAGVNAQLTADIQSLTGSITASGSGYTPGVYTLVAFTVVTAAGTIANAATATITVPGLSGVITTAGSGYADGTYTGVGLRNTPTATYTVTQATRDKLGISSVTGTFAVGNTVTGSVSNAQGTVTFVASDNTFLYITTNSGTFQDGGTESVSNGSGASATLDTVATCLLYTSPSPRDRTRSRMPSSA